MSSVRELHNHAMTFVDQGLRERAQGNSELAIELFRQALEREMAAIENLTTQGGLGWSVLHRSAATMALDCNDFRLAEKLASKALAGDPHPEIAEELRDVWEQSNFQRHLELRGVELAADEMQLSLSGQNVGVGLTPYNEFSGRIDHSIKLMHRIVERRSKRPFREKGRPGKSIEENHQPFISVPRAASFAVTLKIGRSLHQPPLPGLLNIAEVVDEFMLLMNLVDEIDDVSEVQQHIPEPAYLVNFLGLARQIAPDGRRVRQVGFTVVRQGAQRSAKISRHRDQFPVLPWDSSPSVDPETREIQGVLRYADARDLARNVIRIVDDESQTHSVTVPAGLMNDIVKPMWDTEVSVEVQSVRSGNTTVLKLQDIQPREEVPDYNESPAPRNENGMARLL